MIALPIAVVVLTTIALVAISTRPNLAYRNFPADEVPDVLTLNWRAFYAIEEKSHIGAEIPSDIAGRMVRLPGYMLPVEASSNPHREVSRFLLVPDPGNWLHPAHVDDGVLVILAGNSTTPIQDQPVWVRGRLSLFTRDKQARVEFLCCLEEATVYDGTSISAKARDARTTH
jgi:hypothetical protein